MRNYNEIELQWDNEHSQFISSTNLYKKVQGVNNDYLLYQQFTANDSHYFDHNVEAGKSIYYKINHLNNLGISDSRYDFVIVPYRDITKQSDIILDKISYSWRDDESNKAIENWFQGLPEFQIKILRIDHSGNGVELESFKVEATSTRSFNYGKKIHTWLPSNFNWYDVLTFKVVESDPDWGTFQVNVEVKALAKVGTDNMNASIGLEAKYQSPKITFGNGGDDMGPAEYYTYYDPINHSLKFRNFDFQLHFR